MRTVRLLFVYLVAIGALLPGNSEAGASGGEAVAAVQQALKRRLCEEQFWCSGLSSSRVGEGLPLRIWLEGSMFLAEVKGLLSFAGPDSVLYFTGCITKEGPAVPVWRVGWASEPPEQQKADLLGAWYHLLKKKPAYAGTFGPYQCGDPFGDPCPEKWQIIEGLLDQIRYELSFDDGAQELLDAGRIVVTIGEFSCFSESVWVLVEPREAPVWEIKLQRGETCEDMRIIPKGFTLLGTWPVHPNPDQRPMDNPVTPELVDRIRAHGVVVRLAPKPKGK
jgi:hypothetical protein